MIQEALDEALRHADVARAVSLSRQWADQLLSEGRAADQAGIEIARAVASTYRDLITEPVHSYQSQVLASIPEGVGSIVERALKRLIDISLQWEPRVEMVYRERLARELRDFTRGHLYDAALENVRLLCSAARSAEDSLRLAQYCGNILGTCENHPREVETVIHRLTADPGQYALTHELVTELTEARRRRLETLMQGRLETREIEWMRTLTETVVEIARQFPPKERMDDPDEGAVRDAADLMRSLLRIPLWRNQPGKFIDATLLLVEFVPKDLAIAAAQSGIEGRAYTNLGFTAKKAILLAFGELGKSETFAREYEAFARSAIMESPYLKFFVEVMGATRSPLFYEFLTECFGQKKLVSVQEEIVDALGNIGNADARSLLVNHLQEVLSGRVIDPPKVRAAKRVYVSLGKLSRSPRLTDAERADLIRRALKSLPKDQTRLAMHAAMQFLTYNPEPLPKDLKSWGVEVLTQALWLQDDTPEWALGAERQESILGFRKPMTDALKRIVPEAPEPFLRRIDRQALRYSGAYLAVAEVCEETRLELAVPILEKMLRNALTYEESDVTRYEAETYWDASVRERVPLGKDKTVSALVFAIGTIGGPEAYRVLADLQDQVKSGRTELPGPETARHLMNFLERLKGETPAADAVAQAEGTGAPERPAVLTSRHLDELIKALKSSFLLAGASKRRLKKISAISELGQHTPVEAIDPLIQQLTDKDDLVQAAARTALQEYTARDKPEPLRTQALQSIAHALNAKDPALRQGATQTLREIGTGLPEVRTLLEQEIAASDNPSVQKHIQLLIKESSVGKAREGRRGAGVEAGAGALSAAGAEFTAEGSGEEAAAGPGGVSKMDLKRQYVMARQEWIRGGKKGPPPEPPPGV